MAWRLVNTDLKTTSTTSVRSASPVVVIFNGDDRSLAPIIEINTNKANNYNVFELPTPLFTGYLQSLSLGLNLDSLDWQNHAQVELGEPLRVIPNRYWTIDNTIYSYELVKVLNTTINLIIQTFAGVTTDEVLNLQVDDFITDRIEVSGIVFTQGNQVGQFEQSGSTISIYTSTQYRIEAGDSIYLIGTGTYDLIYQDIAIASFVIPEASDVQDVSWLGINFNPSVDIYHPQLYEFFWSEDRKLLTLFLPEVSLPPAIASSEDYLSFISELTYDRPSSI